MDLLPLCCVGSQSRERRSSFHHSFELRTLPAHGEETFLSGENLLHAVLPEARGQRREHPRERSVFFPCVPERMSVNHVPHRIEREEQRECVSVPPCGEDCCPAKKEHTPRAAKAKRARATWHFGRESTSCEHVVCVCSVMRQCAYERHEDALSMGFVDGRLCRGNCVEGIVSRGLSRDVPPGGGGSDDVRCKGE